MNLLELEPQMVVSARWVLGIEAGSSRRTTNACNHSAISPAPLALSLSRETLSYLTTSLF